MYGMLAGSGMNGTVRMKTFFRLMILAAPLALAACGGKDDLDELALNETPPEVLFNEGLALRSQGKLRDSSEKFEELDKLYPYSEYSKKSLVNLAYLNYSRGKYTETVTAAKRFVTLYPGDEDSAYMLYLAGQSYFRQMPDITRDQAVTRKAAGAYKELVQRFPESEYVPDAEKKLRIVEDQLGGKEMQVGRYYLNKRNYIAAINRFKTVVVELPDNAACGRGPVPADRSLLCAWRGQRVANGSRRARPQLSGHAVVQGCLFAAEQGWLSAV